MIKACKSMVFETVHSLMKMESVKADYLGYGVGLPETITWAIREARLHNSAKPTMNFNIKLDGRALSGTKLDDLLIILHP